jgi:resuscitation-promoting factor RpfB
MTLRHKHQFTGQNAVPVHQNHPMRFGGLLIILILMLAACRQEVEAPKFLVSVVADGRERTFQLTESMTVEEFLKQPDVNIDVGDNDRLTPPRFTQLSDGARITIVRVSEESKCETEEIPYTVQTVKNEGLAPGEERLLQPGINGTQEICYRIPYNDGVAGERVQVGQPKILQAPQNQMVMVGIETNPELFTINGTLAYINNQNAWVIQGSSLNKRPLTTTSNLDGLVLALSPDGRNLIYTADPVEDEAFVNELWLIGTSENSQPMKTILTDVLLAEWKPGAEDTISYSTGEVQAIAPFWKALNNIWLMRIDPTTGQSMSNDAVVEESPSGLYSWWGTIYKWSPDGKTLAWARADSAGIVDAEGALTPLVSYSQFRTTQNWSWRANLSWSWDGQLLITTTHGEPLGSEPRDTSPVFDIVATDLANQFEATVVTGAGMWTSPQFSPKWDEPGRKYEYGALAYLKARDPYNSINGEYDLYVGDRDGSNAKKLFPPDGQPGIVSQSAIRLTTQDFTWSPDGRQIALIYQGNLWVVDVATGVAHQLTFDGQSRFPVWAS